MSRAVALSRLQELGIRGRDDPPAEPTSWAGMQVGDGGLRALHEALHPSLLLLTLAGYHIEHVVLGRPDDGDVLLVELSPRAATVLPWGEYLETGGEPEWPFSTTFTVLIWLKPRDGLLGDPVDVPSGTMIAGFPYVAIDVHAPVDLGAIASGLPAAQEPLRQELVTWITQAWWNTDWSVATTGLLAALAPGLWTFPRLGDDEDLRRQAFRRVGEAIADPALATEPAMRAFLLDEASVRQNGRPPSVRDRLDRLTALDPEDVADLVRAWNTEAEALWTQMYPDGDEPFRRADLRQLSYSELVFDILNESMISLAGYDAGATEPAYGGFDLRRGDNDPAAGDTEWVYGGDTQSLDPSAPALPTHIADLRQDLEQVGFGPLADGDGDPATFGAYLEAAVREFQIYASLDGVARFGTPEEIALKPAAEHPSLATRLVPQNNDQAYSGPLCGVLNAETRALVKMWVERDWHCPVVVEARALTFGDTQDLRIPDGTIDKRAIVTNRAIAAGRQNIWRRDQVVPTGEGADAVKFIAWDLTGHYPVTPGRPAGEPAVIAQWEPEEEGVNKWGGAFAFAGRCDWTEAEVRPDALFGEYPERYDRSALWSTFRVIKAISEVECMGVLDGMNAYDSAILSGGPVHWTLGLGKDEDGDSKQKPGNLVIYPGELCPALSYAAADSPEEYHTFFGAFGLQPLEAWTDPPTALFSSGQRKFRGWIAFQDEHGHWSDPRDQRPGTVVGGAPQVNGHDLALVEVLHHWHWIYRWQMAPRTWQRLRTLMWDLARARLRALLHFPWPGTNFTIGSVFTSEQAVAMLERIHVFKPEWVFGLNDYEVEWGGRTSADISLANLQAGFDAAVDVADLADPREWGDTEEAALIDWLSGTGAASELTIVRDWPDMGKHELFKHDDALLPIAKEEAPVIGEVPAVIAAPGAEARVPFTVTDRETPPEQIGISAVSADPAVVPVAVEHLGGSAFHLVLRPPAGAAGEVRVTITADDLRQRTTREVVVSVSATGTPPTGPPGVYTRPDPIGLSALRGSFELDQDGLFQAPPG